MEITNLASGSKGNCTLVDSGKTKILIDAGIPMSEIETKLAMLHVNPFDIEGIIITHEHSDHIKSAGAFCRKYNCKIFANSEEWPILLKKIGEVPLENKKSFIQNEFYIGDTFVKGFELSHDSNSCFGYTFSCEDGKFSIATDLGFAPKSVIENLKDSSLVFLEANHDENLLLNNPKYPLILKKRILSNKGHLSNISCANAILDLMGGNLQQVVLSHLSEENNNPLLAYNTVKEELSKHGVVEGKHIFIDVASQHNIGNTFKIKK